MRLRENGNEQHRDAHFQFRAPAEFVPEFDADGNQTLLKTATGIWHVSYNAENRPVVFSNDTAVVEMGYDYMGRRFEYKETVVGAVTRHERFLYRGYLQIAALDILDGTNALHTIAWDPTEPVATRPLALLRGTNWWSYGFDQVKNVTELFDASGDIAAAYEYAPFGAVTASSGSVAAVNPITFSSEISDAVLGLTYYNYRPLDTLDGRWLTKDPIGDSGGINLYCFVNNNVVCKTDQWGTRTTTIPKCNVVIYLGHNYLVPQGNIKNEPCSAGKVISCGGGRSYDPATPDVEIPGAPPQKKGSDFITNNDAIEEANKAFESGILYARNSICKSTDCCCKTVQVKIICKFGFDIWSRLLFGPLGHNLCGKSETVNCGR